uniref:Truncated nef protein n=1 Tax=Human immunodeficiency virus type 1 TaxID=11676 RepID=H9TQ13_HV1|nr:truncated nef protein [Human immunodeficiency virus 1]
MGGKWSKVRWVDGLL